MMHDDIQIERELDVGSDAQEALVIARILAWSTDHDLPIDTVLDRLPSPTRRLLAAFLGQPLTAFIYGITAANDESSDIGLAVFRSELAGGRTPAASLPDTLGGVLPGYLRHALALSMEEPERRRIVPALLAGTPNAMVKPADVFIKLGGSALYLGIMVFVYTCVLMFVLPGLAWMANETADGAPPIAVTEPLLLVPAWLVGVPAAAILLLLPLAAGLQRLNLGRVLVEVACLALPGVRGLYLLARAREATLSVYTALLLGMDLPDALDWSLRVTDSPWLRRRLERVASDWEGGRHWADAWADGGLAHGQAWALVAGRRTEDPRTAYRDLACALATRQALRMSQFSRWAHVARLVGAALIAVSLIAAVMRTLGQSYLNVVQW